MFSVTVSATTANSRPDGGGVRHLSIADGGGRRLVEFSATPTLFKNLPPEVAADPHLLVEEVEDEKPSASTSAKTKKGRR